MDYSEITYNGQDTTLTGIRHFSLAQVLDCGQCFRWSDTSAEGISTRFEGIAYGRRMVLEPDEQARSLTLKNTNPAEFEARWADYFDLRRDYGALHELYSRDETLARAVQFAPGLRLMRQEPWETLISFILSQNANIPRIKAMTRKLCELFGDPLDPLPDEDSRPAAPTGEDSCVASPGYAFPKPGVLAKLSAEDLAPVRSGYRAAYIIEAARRVDDGSLDLEGLRTLSADAAAAELLKVRGVGPKVADCVLLYGLGKIERYPMDTWMNKAMSKYFPDGFPEYFRDTAGIIQQFLFHFVRTSPKTVSIVSRMP